MKQLKFMLAAATAIGLATASQAGADAQLAASTGFEELDLSGDAFATTGTDNYFYYGGTAADNESKIVGAAAPTGMDRRPHGTGYFTGDKVGQERVLQVNTGTEPLLRSLATFTEAPVAQSLAADMYVDTLVQFTVTPAGDTVDNTADDKLMVYLKEMTDEGGVVTGTNLVVKAGYLTFGEETGPVFSVKDYPSSTVAVEPGKWYRLTVKVLKDVANSEYGFKIQAFTVSINGTALAFSSSYDTESDVGSVLNMDTYGDAFESGLLLSMKAGAETLSSDLKAVGFAGEGYVDDLIITTEDPDTPASTGVDFTLALGEGVSAVTWTIAEGGATITTTTAYTEVEAGEYVITSVTYADWYVADGDYKAGSKVTVADGQTVTVGAKRLDAEGGTTTEAFVEAAETAAAAATALGVNNSVFTAGATEAEAKATLTKGLAWAKKANAAPSILNAVAFADNGDPDGTTAEAYLLDCAIDEVEEAKEDFELTGFTMVDGVPAFAVGAGSVAEGGAYGNGKVEIRGATALDATDAFKAAKKEGDKFFKAFLVK